MTLPTVLSFDPGGTTGWSVISVHEEALVDPELYWQDNIMHWEHGQISCNNSDGKFDLEAENNGIAEMVGLAEHWPGALIVVEGYTVRNPRTDLETYTPIRIIAGFAFGLWQLQLKFIQQQASEKGTATDDRLRHWGLYERSGGMQHARDADRHAAVAIRKACSRPGLRARFWPHIYDEQGEIRK